jgi:hypothetical protein
MGEITKKEDEWQRRATDAAIADARKVVDGSRLLPHTPVGRLSDQQWGWIVTGVIFAWIRVRCEQAIAQGLDQEQAVRLIASSPSPGDVAVVHSILPALAELAAIDWSQPLAAWSKDTMVSFLLLTWQLINKAEVARDHAPGEILRKAPAPVETPITTPTIFDEIPEFLRRAPPRDWDDKKGDDLPFDL